jgi:hypothetical protein
VWQGTWDTCLPLLSTLTAYKPMPIREGIRHASPLEAMPDPETADPGTAVTYCKHPLHGQGALAGYLI